MTPSEPTRTFTPGNADPTAGPFDPTLDAALLAAFGPESTLGGWSQPPLLRYDSTEDSPLVQPSSSEMPRYSPGRYQLLGEIVPGGMGVILKGRDPDLGRDMAFKVLKTEHVGKPAAEQRFVEEAQVGGQLQHPGILPVYDIGRFADGRPFFAMKFVKGETLAQKLAERPDPAADRGQFLQIFLKVCETVAYAHSSGVIHRDIKPSNIMVAKYGEVLVMDWGLAKVLPRGGIADEAKGRQPSRERERPEKYEPTVIHTARVGSNGSETPAGSVLGTPAFMPPEQAGGEIDKLDERADVFGLGAVLCVIMTGEPPYVAGDAEAVRLMAVRGELDEAFRRLNASDGDAELIGLCKRCLSAEPADRPRHAGEVKDAVAEYLTGVEDRAHRAEIERAKSEATAAAERKRRRAQLALAASVGLLLVSGGAFAWYSDRHAADRRQEQAVAAAKARQVVETALDQAEAALKAEKMPEADAALAVAEQRLADTDAKDLRDRFEDVRKDPDMVRELDDIAEQRWAVHDERQRWAGTNPKIGEWFDEAFHRYGLAVGECDPADTAARIRSSRVSAALVAGLNEWFFLVPKQPGVLAVLDRADPDSVRVELRAAVAAGQEDRVRELTTNLDAATLTPGFAVALGMHPALSDEEGYKLLRAAWDAHPDSFGLALRIGSRLSEMAQTTTGDREHALEAVAWNRTAIALRPRSAVAHSNLGAALSRNGDFDGAIAACREAIRLDPKFTLARNNLGVTLCQKGDLPGAIKEGREAIRLDPNNASAHYHLGNALDEKGDHDGAVVQYREAIRLDPKNAAAHNNLGFALSRKGDVDNAVVEYREAIRLDPKSFMAHNGLAWLLATGSDRVRNGKLSVDHATKACELSGWKDPSPLDTLAAANAEAGDFDKAVEYEKKALAVPGIDQGLQRELKKRLALFEQRRPYRVLAIAPPELGPSPHEVK